MFYITLEKSRQFYAILYVVTLGVHMGMWVCIKWDLCVCVLGLPISIVNSYVINVFQFNNRYHESLNQLEHSLTFWSMQFYVMSIQCKSYIVCRIYVIAFHHIIPDHFSMWKFLAQAWCLTWWCSIAHGVQNHHFSGRSVQIA